MRLYVDIEDREDIKEIYGIIEYMDGTLKKHDKLMVVKPCEDAISRQDVLSYLCAHCPDNAECFDDCDDIKNIKALPSVRPQEPFDIETYCKEHFMVMVDKDVWEKAEKALEQEPKYCDRNICLKNEYNGIGCGECEVTKSQEPKTGHWIGHREHCENLGVLPSGLGAYEWCSECDCGIDVREWHRNNYNYCPNCGAKMESEEEHDTDR